MKSDVTLGIIRSYIKDKDLSYTGFGGKIVFQKFEKSKQSVPIKRGFPHATAYCALVENWALAQKYETSKLSYSNWASV